MSRCECTPGECDCPSPLLMTEPIKPATDEEITHGRISLDEMYACENCPTERGGRCFRCSIHPAILARLDADAALLRERDEEIAGLVAAHDTAQEGLKSARAQEGLMRQQIKERDEQIARYQELIYAVGNKYSGESRHETALRYIRERENQPSTTACEVPNA